MGELFEAISPFLLNNEDAHRDPTSTSSSSSNTPPAVLEGDVFKIIRSPSDHRNSSVYGEVKLTENDVSEIGRIILTELLDNFDSVFLVFAPST